MEFLEKNLDWLKGKLDAVQGQFLLFDCPGQAELYTHHTSVQNILAQLQKWKYSVRSSNKPRILLIKSDSIDQYHFSFALFQIATVHLIDAHHCCDASKFISVLLLSLSTMVHLGMPHVNILSKIDLVHQYGKLGAGGNHSHQMHTHIHLQGKSICSSRFQMFFI
jgi:hypothetical protein